MLEGEMKQPPNAARTPKKAGIITIGLSRGRGYGCALAGRVGGSVGGSVGPLLLDHCFFAQRLLPPDFGAWWCHARRKAKQVAQPPRAQPHLHYLQFGGVVGDGSTAQTHRQQHKPEEGSSGLARSKRREQ